MSVCVCFMHFTRGTYIYTTHAMHMCSPFTCALNTLILRKHKHSIQVPAYVLMLRIGSVPSSYVSLGFVCCLANAKTDCVCALYTAYICLVWFGHWLPYYTQNICNLNAVARRMTTTTDRDRTHEAKMTFRARYTRRPGFVQITYILR